MSLHERTRILLEQIRRLAGTSVERNLSDRELLERFTATGDDAAFRALMDRYAPMVLRVCRRLLGDQGEAEDAFQATFVLLASRAASIRKHDSLAGWLHRVAVRVSQQELRAARRRRAHESRAAKPEAAETTADLTVREVQAALDEELAALPESYRIPLLQCHLLGRKREQVAHELGHSLRTLDRRLEKGLQLLKRRLTARGVEVPGTLLIVLLAGGGANAVVPTTLMVGTLRVVEMFLRGQSATAVSPATALAAATLQAMTVVRFKLAAVVVAAILLLGSGATIPWQFRGPSSPPAMVVATSVPEPDQPESPRPLRPTAVIAGHVVDAAGQAVAHAHVEALARRAFAPGEHGLRDEILDQGATDEHGAFRLSVPADFPTWFQQRQVALLATAPGHAPTTAVVSLAQGADATPLPTRGADATPLAMEVTLRLVAPDMVVRGRLLGPDGAPASGVRLRVIRLGDVAREPVHGAAADKAGDPAWPRPVLSDAAGHFELSGTDPVQGAWLEVDDDRFAPDAFRVVGREPAPVIQLKRAQVIDVKVVAADTGLPLAGVKLTARDPGFPKQSRLTVADHQGISARVDPIGPIDGVTGADGRFRLYPPAGPKTFLEFHPPADSPYLAIYKPLTWPDGIVQQTLTVSLPRGVIVRGRVVDEHGRPVAGAVVQFQSSQRRDPEQRTVLQWRDHLVLTGPDGRFSLATLAGPVSIMAHGPTHEFRAQVVPHWGLLEPHDGLKRWGWREPAPTQQWIYAHAQTMMELTSIGPNADVQLRLVRGEPIGGQLLGPNGQAVQSAVLLCEEKRSPLRMGCALPLPVHGGRYELPGCTPGRVYPVLFLDAAHGQGAALDLTAGRSMGPEVRLSRCGSARIRVLSATGQPAMRKKLDLIVLIERSFSAAQPPAHRQADAQLASWHDPVLYAEVPQTDVDSWLTLPTLIPGARYCVYDPQTRLQYPDFTVSEGEHKQLPDLLLVQKENLPAGITLFPFSGKGR